MCLESQTCFVRDTTRSASPTYTITMMLHCNSHCITLQHPATFCNMMQQCTATHRNTLGTFILAYNRCWGVSHLTTLQFTASHCNTVQHSATMQCNALKHTMYLDTSIQQMPGRFHFWPNATQTATHCNTLQHTATTHCNTLQHIATD